MSDLLGIGVSGLQAFKRELDTTSHNIANVNTEGYSRQRVDLAARKPDQYGFGYMGNGVGVDGVKRIVDEFLDRQILSNSTSFSQMDTFHNLVSRVDDLLANADAGLTPTLQSFFNAAQDVANDPTSIPARQVFLARAETLVDRLYSLDQQMANLASQTNSGIGSTLNEVNSLAEGIAMLNRDITTAFSGTNRQPNDLLDKRDQMIRELSEFVDVQVVSQSNGALNVFIGTGQALVVDGEARTLAAVNNAFDPQQIDIVVRQGSNSVVITEQMRGGAIGGSLDFLNQVLYPARNELGRIAVGLAGSFNEQHRQGLDLDGNLGGDFFQALNTGNLSPTVMEGVNNSSAGSDVLTARYADVSQLGNSNYQVRYLGSNQYEVMQTSTNQTRTFTGPNFSFDGLDVEISSAPSVGDTYLIRPSYGLASSLDLAIRDPRAIAAGLPVLGAVAATGNTGDAGVAVAAASDGTPYQAGDYSILLGSVAATAGADGGASIGDFTNASGLGNSLGYELSLNGIVVHTQAEADAPLADLDALAAAINDDVALTGVRAYVEGGNLYLANDPASNQPISVTETLLTTGTPDDADTISGYFGTALTGASNDSATINFSASADSYLVLDGSGTVLDADAYTSGATIAFNGLEAVVTGSANLGDRFSIAGNQGGVGDNRNMLALAGLQTKATLDKGNASYLDVYGRMVANVGAKSQQAAITRDAQATLLQQSVSARESVSGVNLDEEAAALIRFQQAYQAAAQVISTANELFQTLLGAVRR